MAMTANLERATLPHHHSPNASTYCCWGAAMVKQPELVGIVELDDLGERVGLRPFCVAMGGIGGAETAWGSCAIRDC